MGVVGTFCQLCGMPTQHDHYVPTGGMLKIYRGAQPGGGHDWAPGETPFAFGPEHAWLLDAVVLPWDEERVLRGAIEDGVIDDGEGDPVMVWDGGDDGLALHHACWELQGSPRSTGPAVRANDTHAWTMVEGYHEQLFEFAELARDGMTMLVITHEMGFARRAADRVVLMADGQLVEEATPTLFFENPTSDRARDFLGKILSH